MSSVIPRELGTPKQWLNTLMNPDEWTSTQSYKTQLNEAEDEQNRNAQQQADAVAAKAAAKAKAELEAKTASDKIAADEASAKEAAEKAAAALALRRRASKKYYTVGGAQGLLSEAPVLLKTLLGQ